jgi:hypothetical protein
LLGKSIKLEKEGTYSDKGYWTSISFYPVIPLLVKTYCKGYDYRAVYDSNALNIAEKSLSLADVLNKIKYRILWSQGEWHTAKEHSPKYIFFNNSQKQHTEQHIQHAYICSYRLCVLRQFFYWCARWGCSKEESQKKKQASLCSDNVAGGMANREIKLKDSKCEKDL